MRIILSRTDSIGDVVLTLPMASALKQTFPDCTIIFLGREYTRPVVELCRFVDEFVVWDVGVQSSRFKVQSSKFKVPYYSIDLLRDLKADAIIHVFPVEEICRAAKRAGIPIRIATARRFFTWCTCNRLLHIPRKNSNLHESQLNLKMLKGLGIKRDFMLEEISGMYGLKTAQETVQLYNYTSGEEPNAPRPSSLVPRPSSLVLHPKSKGSAREWGLENFSRLIELLPAEKFNILITGTKEEGILMKEFLEQNKGRVTDLTGKLNLYELIELIRSSDALVAASTGPLHIAAALGIRAIGLYAPMRTIFPQRWAPVGTNATFLVIDKTCNDCRKNMDCHCIRSITPEAVAEKLTKYFSLVKP
ncbi:MAG: glycosyltransferase family 9 protein [Bacteroidetes bacterium]|nr:glycosyltransferase family 9 protein [Bacteroidota bacterium]